MAQEQAPENDPEAEAEGSNNETGARSLRPGQKGFAERLLSKYGWTKGSGLGADGSGIAKPLQVKVEKRKKRPDSEGGGFVTPSGRGTIIGGKRKGGDDPGKFGVMSEVIVLRGMLDGMDLDTELSGEGGGLMQEIGEECSEKVCSSFPSIIFSVLGTLILTRSTVWKCRTRLRCQRCRHPGPGICQVHEPTIRFTSKLQQLGNLPYRLLALFKAFC
jgi:hypothetical protein